MPGPEDWEEIRRLLEEIDRKIGEIHGYIVPSEAATKAQAERLARGVWRDRYDKGLAEAHYYHFRKRSYVVYHGKPGTEIECHWSPGFRIGGY